MVVMDGLEGRKQQWGQHRTHSDCLPWAWLCAPWAPPLAWLPSQPAGTASDLSSAPLVWRTLSYSTSELRSLSLAATQERPCFLAFAAPRGSPAGPVCLWGRGLGQPCLRSTFFLSPPALACTRCPDPPPSSLGISPSGLRSFTPSGCSLLPGGMSWAIGHHPSWARRWVGVRGWRGAVGAASLHSVAGGVRWEQPLCTA